MNEVTRIHLAKTSYDIEVPAKKDLKEYINSLESYTNDVDVLTDIEIRMTELLAERGVQAGGVIGRDDVAAIRSQLGEPHDFAEEGAVPSSPEAVSRRLYRDTDNSVLGGVLSGFSAYLGINPLWFRLIFIVIMFASFGVAMLAYIILWIAIPPVRTATDRLRLTGKAVTLGSIQQLSDAELDAKRNKIAPAVQRFLAITLGTISAICAAATVIGIVSLAVAKFRGGDDWWMSFGVGVSAGDIWLIYGIVVTGLVLLAALFSLIAYSFFARKLTRKNLMTGIIIIVLGVTSVLAAAAVAGFASWNHSAEVQRLTKVTRASLPADFSAVKTIEFVDKQGTSGQGGLYEHMSASYVVSADAPRYEIAGLEGVRPKVVINGDKAVISIVAPESSEKTNIRPSLTIYGPALSEINTKDGWYISYMADSQDTLRAVTESGTSIDIQEGRVGELVASGAGNINAAGASIVTLSANVTSQGAVHAGTVRTLVANLPDVCPSNAHDDSRASVTVDAVTDGSINYNGAPRAAVTYATNCALVQVGDEDYTAEEY